MCGQIAAPPLDAERHRFNTDLLEIMEPLIQLVGLPPYEIVHVGARCTASPFDADDLANLDEREAEPLRAPDEFEQPHRLGIVCAVARPRPPHRRQDAGRLVEADRLSRRSAPLRQLADE